MDRGEAIEEQTIVFRLLKHRGIKMQRFAEMIGFSWDYVHSIRIGRRPISDEFRRRCAAYFQLPEDVLFFARAGDKCIRTGGTAGHSRRSRRTNRAHES